MEHPIFRKKSLERIAAPEALNDYLHVTGPAVWLILCAVILLLAGLLIWSSSASIDSFATGTAHVENGSMYVYFDNAGAAQNIEPGMTVIVGDTKSTVSSIGSDAKGTPFAHAYTDLADGDYSARIFLRSTQLLSLLFN